MLTMNRNDSTDNRIAISATAAPRRLGDWFPELRQRMRSVPALDERRRTARIAPSPAGPDAASRPMEPRGTGREEGIGARLWRAASRRGEIAGPLQINHTTAPAGKQTLWEIAVIS